MAQSTQHISVLLAESIQGLAIDPAGIYIDATFGRGGHSRAILSQLNEQGHLYAFDRDPSAAKAAQELAHDPRFTFFHTAFSALPHIAAENNLTQQVAGVLFDLGVSSPQLDNADRGFSFMNDGPLDMRMNPEQGLSAAQWLATTEMGEMARVFREYGEEKFAGRIARAICEKREEQPLERTSQLAQLISDASPKKERHKHPATRVFQAIRIAINEELQEAELALEAAVDVLRPGGRLAVISFHSLEDRLTKRLMRRLSQREQIPAGLPLREDEIPDHRKLKLVGKAIKPSVEEIAENPRCRSSVLRVAERLP
ncbi:MULTISPECIES: 16S rRNA (cytosine(1402)-N(4))-methyltransferase RsmH [Gammaproteobacteria]|uniref:16S rRNA (cytosine(1402)-N(4))-methyltransferase RsmH n=1 Tax=Gammaproteobacteria TaxID=1236 RepID=UPI000DD08BDD|nr:MULTISPECIES: 16S rRNA (cytosine(1402)-N(4))-methyltransferase RsmH [Gammaproteobacteria]RTE86324.1 16S rRNA (cytosine(1402)-N(4))-methyltransferase RsmH [Aliidiomarina sp. B3213]TCZ91674.1 16S rRNA (cytosine(1402)-N(4))-methyltransferase RsmH [Lysobacter sp. N42]